MTPLEHFFSAIWLNYDPRKKYVLMAKTYTIYGDASGQGKSGDVLCVTGIGSSASRWLKFETRWLALLKRYKITPPFHATDFANGADQYASWKHEQQVRADFQADAIQIIKKSINKCFAVSVAVDELRRHQREYRLPGKISQEHPYVWCTMLMYVKVSTWLDRHPSPDDLIEVVFERGDVGQLVFPNRLREMCPHMDLPDFKDKRLAPLQAVDFLAYEFRRGPIRQATGDPVRKSLSEILRHLPHDRRHYTFDDLTRLAKRWRFPKRAESDVRSLTSRRKHRVE